MKESMKSMKKSTSNMKKRVNSAKISMISIMILAAAVICLAGCGSVKGTSKKSGSENSSRQISDAVYVPENEYVEYCRHYETDDRGICLACGKEAGVALTMDDPKEIFDIEAHGVDNYGGAWKIKITPKREYAGCRFENVSILLKGTKLASDGWTLNRNQELLEIPLDENGEAEWSGLLGDLIETPYWELGRTVFGVLPRMHYSGYLGKVNVISKHKQDEEYTVESASDEVDPTTEECEPAAEECENVIAEVKLWKFGKIILR